ncbi:MAG: 50S ribosomal protein L22 [Candidatus Burarchaeum sp.]|nr:50S ribosomal protein L22 [Candidatus Burarchaeum sp.]MDO8339363.1 50S ribosomal protein L22 [Candidatus Burarchaeum sp.]
MVEFRYGYVGKAGEKAAKAQTYDVDASYKDLCEMCSDIRGTLAEPALTRLALVAKGKTAVYFARHNKRLGHRHELGGKKGRYPEKAAKIVRKVLENALANAAAIGIQTPYVAHICANKHRIFPRLAPKGRRGRNDYETARVEIVLKEMEVERAEITKKEPKLLKVKMEAEKMQKEQNAAKKENKAKLPA